MAKRSALSAGRAMQLSMRISEAVLQWEPYQKADAVYFYYPLGNEVSLLPVVKDALSRGVPTAFPKVTGETMQFWQVYGLDELKEGAFHVQEPSVCRPVQWAHAICFVPGAAFDQGGGRFGYGKGYYDRYFSTHLCRMLVGCAYGFQVAKELPADAWDRRMDCLATESGVVRCRAIQ